LPVSSKSSFIRHVLVAGGLAPRHWLENEELRAMIDQSPLGQLIAEFCSTPLLSPKLAASETAINEGPVPRFLPHERWLASKQAMNSYGDLAATSVLNDWPQFIGNESPGNAANQLATEPVQRNGLAWWRIDPVYCQLATDHIVLGRAVMDDLTLGQAQQLAAALSEYCTAHGFSIQVAHPQRWYLHWNVPSQPAALDTSSPLAAQGRSIQLYLPQNHSATLLANPEVDHARNWRRLVGEAEVSWFSHPVNTTRQVAGQLPINSLWLIGPCPSFVKHPTISTQPQAMAAQTNQPVASVLADRFLEENLIFLQENLIITEPINELVNDRAYEWAFSIGAITTATLKPIVEQLQAGHDCTVIFTSDQEILELKLSPPTLFEALKRRLGFFKPQLHLSSICAQSVLSVPNK
jgi:hypothetical protein